MLKIKTVRMIKFTYLHLIDSYSTLYYIPIFEIRQKVLYHSTLYWVAATCKDCFEVPSERGNTYAHQVDAIVVIANQILNLPHFAQHTLQFCHSRVRRFIRFFFFNFASAKSYVFYFTSRTQLKKVYGIAHVFLMVLLVLMVL